MAKVLAAPAGTVVRSELRFQLVGDCIKCVDTFRQYLPPAVAAGLGRKIILAVQRVVSD